MISTRLAWASALLFAIALFYAPLAYGCTRPETLPPLWILLGLAIVLGGFSFLQNNRTAPLPRVMLAAVGLILAQGWWCTLDPVFHTVQIASTDVVDTSFDHLKDLSLQSMTATTFLLGGFVIASALLAQPQLRRFLLLSVAASGILICIIGIFFKIGGDRVMAYFWDRPDIDWNDFAFYRYHGNAGAFLNLVWPIILVFTRRAYSPTVGFFKRTFWTAAALTCGAALMLNASKASLIIGLLILPWPFSTLLLNMRKRKLAPVIIIAICFLAAGIYATSHFTNEDAFDRMIDGGQVQASAGGRMLAYRQYLDAMPQLGFFGVGPGLFQVAFPYQLSPLGNVQPGLREYAHEDFLQTMIEWGWLGSVWWFLLFMGGLFVAFRSYSHRALFSSRTDRHLLLGALLGVIGTLVQSLVDFPLQIASLRLFFLTLLALCWASPQLLAPPEKKVVTPTEKQPVIKPSAGHHLVTPAN